MRKITANDPEAKSPDLAAENLARLRALFPEAVTEGADGPAVNVDVLKSLIGDRTVSDAEEKYGLTWHGKRRARQGALSPSTGTLRPCPEDSVDWDTTQNLMIEGDNLEVLKLLQKSYAGKVKLIYIDPPYNTGKDFVYPDNFQDTIRNYLELTGQVEGGQKISSNTEASGRFHTDWLMTLYPRLKIARNLLREDGVILISIDDNEIHNLRFICNEIFGDECWLGTLVWHNSSRNSSQIAIEHEYILVYGRTPAANGSSWNRSRDIAFRLESLVQQCKTDGQTIEDAETLLGMEIRALLEEDEHRGSKENTWLRNYTSVDSNWNIYYAVDLSGEGPGPARRFGDRVMPAPLGRHWMGQGYIDELLSDNRIVWRGDRAYRKLYIRESMDNLKSIIRIPTRNGSETLKKLLGKDVFDKPKPHNLVRHLAYFAMECDDIALDFYAGSGTTGHAIWELNAADGGTRRYILVQLPEPIEQEVSADFCDQLGKPRNIAEITKERLRRAGQKLREENPLFPGDLGFRVFKLDTSNLRAWDPDRGDLAGTLAAAVEHVKAGRTEGDLLYELLLKLGLELTVPMTRREIAGKTVHSIGAGTLLACLAESISAAEAEPLGLGLVAWHRELAPAGDSSVVFRDSAFADDVAKTNLAAILAQHGLENVRSL